MKKQDDKRNVLYGEKDGYKKKVQQSEQFIAEGEVGKDILEQIQGIVKTTESQVHSGLSKQINELGKKRDQFDQHFIEVLRDHCRYEEDRLVSISDIGK